MFETIPHHSINIGPIDKNDDHDKNKDMKTDKDSENNQRDEPQTETFVGAKPTRFDFALFG